MITLKQLVLSFIINIIYNLFHLVLLETNQVANIKMEKIMVIFSITLYRVHTHFDISNSWTFSINWRTLKEWKYTPYFQWKQGHSGWTLKQHKHCRSVVCNGWWRDWHFWRSVMTFLKKGHGWILYTYD